jgi:CRP-like cAMP-binding protein
MACSAISHYLTSILEEGSERIHRKKSTILFPRGDKAAGMFVVLSGRVTLDNGVDSACSRFCGPGALVGLPSTLTLHDYSMSATVTEDAELRFLTPERLHSLLRGHPELCGLLMAILKDRIESCKVEASPNREEACNTAGEGV